MCVVLQVLIYVYQLGLGVTLLSIETGPWIKQVHLPYQSLVGHVIWTLFVSTIFSVQFALFVNYYMQHMWRVQLSVGVSQRNSANHISIGSLFKPANRTITVSQRGKTKVQQHVVGERRFATAFREWPFRLAAAASAGVLLLLLISQRCVTWRVVCILFIVALSCRFVMLSIRKWTTAFKYNIQLLSFWKANAYFHE